MLARLVVVSLLVSTYHAMANNDLPVILGATNPLASNPGTIRGDYAIDVGRNVCHGSDGVESAKKEIALWFGKDEVISYKQSQFDWIYEKP